MPIPLWILFIHGFATGFLTTWLGLVLVNIHPGKRKLVGVGFCYALLAMIIRSLPLHFGVHFGILTFLLVFVVQWMWNLKFVKAFIPVVLGNLIMTLCEILFLEIAIVAFDIKIINIMSDNKYLLLASLPQIITVLLLIHLSIKLDIYIFNFNKRPNHSDNYVHHYNKEGLMVFLVTFMLLLLVFQGFYIVSMHNDYPVKLFDSISNGNLGLIMSLTVISITLIMFYLIKQLINLINQENKFLVQQTYLETIDEMIIAIRSQQHDQISHLQTLYGYIQLGYLEDARQYLEEMIGDIALSQHFSNISDPGISALAYTKTAQAIAKGINFEISVRTDLHHLTIPPYELNRILGNLIGNSFDHVSELNEDMKQVWLRVDREDDYYVFEVANCGHIDTNLANKIFDKGVTSKSGGHSGLGLFIVRELVNQHGGKIMFSNENGKVIFTVYLPMKEDKHESISPEVSTPASPKLA